MSTFGESVEYRPVAGGTFDIRGIFEKNPKVFDIGSQSMVSTNEPELDIKDTALALEPIEDDKLTVDGQNYRVSDTEVDGRGGIKLFLRKI